jgi:hypothetical protein
MKPIAFVLLVFAGACGSRAPAPTSATSAPPASAPAAAARPAPPLPPGAPDAPVGHQLAWVIDVVNQRDGKLRRDEIEAHFHPDFLAQVNVDQTMAAFLQLADGLAPLELGAIEAPRPGGLIARAKSKAGEILIHMHAEEKTGLIDGLLLKPAEEAAAPKSFSEVLSTVPKLAPRAQFLAASLDVDRGKCVPLHQYNAGESLAIGSTFKLYVLLALADLIAGGKTSWDAPLAIRDEWKSLPSGTFQDEPAGKTLTVRAYAENMISISDNTATDHLLYTVGRGRVEAALKAARHARPAVNVPLLSTRELFLFKLALSPDEVTAYLKLSASKRRAYLDKTLAGRKASLDGAAAWKEPRHIEDLEWFASANDLCNVMAVLSQRARSKPETAPLLDVLAKNPGMPISKETWPFVGFKGGSEPGVLNLSWLLRRDDGRWFVLIMGFNDPKGAVEESKVLGLTSGIFGLLAQEGRAAER